MSSEERLTGLSLQNPCAFFNSRALLWLRGEVDGGGCRLEEALEAHGRNEEPSQVRIVVRFLHGQGNVDLGIYKCDEASLPLCAGLSCALSPSGSRQGCQSDSTPVARSFSYLCMIQRTFAGAKQLQCFESG
ncbi:hypothetical protein CH063_12633 [Colletotrichum higginsianum]|uniref:Uncharacterized protein n=1 Tax=Colletotrichum higginsianum (strain IMI 349063) TaxID=759273 RepID=H1VR62_COLHI|nr:hypothetical protein CH063_12633 [Colletotrichum higginsianum]